MNCPDCTTNNTSIQDTRKIENGDAVRRRRECNECGFRFTTYERKDWNSLRVKKIDGTTEPYDEEKVRSGIETAVEKRPISPETVTQVTKEITAELKNRDEQIIGSTEIGATVAEHLRELDGVAYIRFVSVYKGYSNPEDFREVLNTVLANTNNTTNENSEQTENGDLDETE